MSNLQPYSYKILGDYDKCMEAINHHHIDIDNIIVGAFLQTESSSTEVFIFTYNPALNNYYMYYATGLKRFVNLENLSKAVSTSIDGIVKLYNTYSYVGKQYFIDIYNDIQIALWNQDFI